MKTEDLRAKFLAFFSKNGHTIVPSSSLVPQNDPSLLFTNAGMVQFKDLFLGAEVREYSCAASSQKCVRAGGKHNDLENVGFTARHHTFFEMLGNFSFGDYFKKEAIKLAWEFVTVELKLPKEKLWITVYKDDQEAEDIWLKEIGVSSERFSRCGEKDNFWSMGDTGPCGPCSEIFYDHGAHIWGGPPDSKDEDGDRYTEIWNLVFMQFHRTKDGALNPLPKKSIDTGMGLERVAAILQGVHSNYEIDIFVALINKAAQILNCNDHNNKSLRVIADHIRSCAFLIADGVIPFNEGRGYVLRRIMRRAIRHGKKLGSSEPFFYRLVEVLVATMGSAYPDLKLQQSLIERTIKTEEKQFAKTIDQGLKLLEQELENLSGNTLGGEVAFKLYDTYGFPLDLTADIAQERNIAIDEAGFNSCMQAQQQRARSSNSYITKMAILPVTKSVFVGYESTSAQATVTELFTDDTSKEIYIVLDKTPFYAESGGQIGDTGELKISTAEQSIILQVTDTKKIADAIVHICPLPTAIIAIGSEVVAQVNNDNRDNTRRNHSATHLLHAALKQIIGPHVKQKGSLVYPKGFRFDFSHNKPLTKDELYAIEELVNKEIIKNSLAKIQVMSYPEALKAGAVALFGEKYGSEVRVLTLGDNFSVELCGGTHVAKTGDIGLFKIIAESGVASGVRRIEGITGMQAYAYLKNIETTLNTIATSLKTNPDNIAAKINQVIEKNKVLETEIMTVKRQLLAGAKQDSSIETKTISSATGLNINVVAKIVPLADSALLRETMDTLKDKLKTAVIALAGVNDNKINIIVGVTQDCTAIIRAGELAAFIAAQVGGKGGGRADFAQGGGSDLTKITTAMESVFSWVKEKV